MGSTKLSKIFIYYGMMIQYFWFRDPTLKKDLSIYAHIWIFNYQLLDQLTLLEYLSSEKVRRIQKNNN